MQGTGGDVSEALDDLCAGIIQYYEALRDNVPIVGEQSRFASQKYAHLKQIIEVKTETNPWLKIRGVFADDPNFDEFIEEIKARRKELDNETNRQTQLLITSESIPG